MKKFKILFTLLLMFIGINTVNAYTYSVSANKYTVQVGDTVSITLKTNDVMGRYSITSSDSSILVGNDSNTIDSGGSYSKNHIFQAKKVGTATVTVSGLNVYSTEAYLPSRSVTIKVVEKSVKKSIDVNKNYSKNNNLKSLSIEGYKLSPEFNKDTLEYKVELEPGTEKIKINASKEDSEANIKGTGEFNVSDGTTTFKIIVTAENGNEKTYKIVVNMEEKDPINVKFDGKEYTVVKKSDLLKESMEGYEKTTIKINDFDIPTFYNDITKVNLVGLKDKEGNIILVSYDSKDGSYKAYKEISFDKINLYVQEDLESDYEKTTIKINDEKVVGYKLKNMKEFVLIYGTNVVTGNTGYYLYDKVENTVQRYNTDIIDKLTEENQKYFIAIVSLAGISLLSIIFLIIKINKKVK